MAEEYVIISSDSTKESPLYLGKSVGGKKIQWVEEWKKPIVFSSREEAQRFFDPLPLKGGVIIEKESKLKKASNKKPSEIWNDLSEAERNVFFEIIGKGNLYVNRQWDMLPEDIKQEFVAYNMESKLQKAAKPKESKLSKALKTAKAKTIESYVKAEEKVKEAIEEKKSEMEKYIKVNDLKKFGILEFTKNGKMMKLEKAVRGFNIEDRPGNKHKVIIYHYTPELEDFLTSNKIKATVFDSKEELDEWLTNQL